MVSKSPSISLTVPLITQTPPVSKSLTAEIRVRLGLLPAALSTGRACCGLSLAGRPLKKLSAGKPGKTCGDHLAIVVASAHDHSTDERPTDRAAKNRGSYHQKKEKYQLLERFAHLGVIESGKAKYPGGGV